MAVEVFRDIYRDPHNNGVVDELTYGSIHASFSENGGFYYSFITLAAAPIEELVWPLSPRIFNRCSNYVEAPAGSVYCWQTEVRQVSPVDIDGSGWGLYVGLESGALGYFLERYYDLTNHYSLRGWAGFPAGAPLFDSPFPVGSINGNHRLWIYVNCDTVPHSIEGGALSLLPGYVSMWTQLIGTDPSPVLRCAQPATGAILAPSTCIMAKYTRVSAQVTPGIRTMTGSFNFVNATTCKRLTSRRWYDTMDNGVVDESTEIPLTTAITELGEQRIQFSNSVRAGMGWAGCPISFIRYADVVETTLTGLFRNHFVFTSGIALDDVAKGIFLFADTDRQNGYLLEQQRTAGPVYTVKAYRVVAGVLTEIASTGWEVASQFLGATIYWNNTSTIRPTPSGPPPGGSLLLAPGEVGFTSYRQASLTSWSTFIVEIPLFKENANTILTSYPVARMGWYARSIAAGANISLTLRSANEFIITQDIGPFSHYSSIHLGLGGVGETDEDSGGIFIVARDIIMLKFSGNLSVNRSLKNPTNYVISDLSTGSTPATLEVLPILESATNTILLRISQLTYGHRYQITIPDQRLYDTTGALLDEQQANWVMRRTKVDAAVDSLAKFYATNSRSTIRSMLEAIMMSDEKIGGDF
jgi:hypothetical protein